MASWILIFFGKGSTNFQYLPHFPQLHDGRREEICVGDLSGCGMIVAGCNIVVGRLSHKRLYCQHLKTCGHEATRSNSGPPNLERRPGSAKYSIY